MLTMWYLVLAISAIVMKAGLVALAIADIVHVKKERVNGAVQFMTLDNFRHQVFLLAVVCLVYSGHLAFETHPMWIFILVWIDVLFGFRRRSKMAVLVGEFLKTSMPGGRRSMDRCRGPQ